MYKNSQIKYMWRNYYLQIIVDSIIYEAFVEFN